MAGEDFPTLSDHHFEILPIYDVIVVGSGYGGAIAASRCARAGQAVCVLEKGKEWLPGQFPETFNELSKNCQVKINGKRVYGQPTDLFNCHSGDGVQILTGVGLGGGSLINANVSFEQKPVFFEKPQWPKQLQEDIKDLYDVDAEHAKAMLQPTIWPATSPYTEPGKMKELEKAVEGLSGVDIEDLGKFIKKIPLFVNFKDGSNAVGIKQPACNGCGNCISGCNTGAKNTLNLNYLPDAKAHGAHIFTKIDVLSVTRDSYTGLWLVRYHRDTSGRVKNQVTKARFVFIAAGTIGTTKLMLRSRENGLHVSDCLGDNFNTNNDMHGFCYGLNDDVNCIGLQKSQATKEPYKVGNPGTAVTTVVDLRSDSLDRSNDLVIADICLPGALRNVLSAVLGTANASAALSRVFDKGFFKTYQDVDPQPISNMLSLFSMSKNIKHGRIEYNIRDNDVYIKHEEILDDENFSNANERMKEIANKLGGTFIAEEKTASGHFSAHPLGGCIMGETGEEGVVNHKGQVFIDNTSDVYDGLYIVDGSIVPCDVGVHPCFTICMLAERCLRLCAKDHGWIIDYSLSQDVIKKIGQSSKQTPGLIMTERMVGELKMNESGESFFFDFKLTVESLDVKKMIDLDPEHRARMSGSATCPGLSKEPITISEGVFKLLRNSTTQVNGKEMIYSMVLNTVEGQQYYFHGIKLIHKDKFGEIGLRDTTILFITVFKGKDGTGEAVGKGELLMKLTDFAEQLTTIKITHSDSFLERTKLTLAFVKFFAKSLWQTYITLSSGSLLDPNAPPRVKRPLKLGKATPVVYKIVTEDKIELRLTRYQGGTKGPVMLVHGLGVASNLFLMDTVDMNFVEFLVDHKYDVWLFDWRVSISLPWASYTQFTVDDVAKYDFPAAVDKVLEVTKEKDIQLVIHCFGAIACIASVLLGKLEGKVRCIITSQVSATPIGSCVNKFKSNGCFADMFSKFGGKSVTAYVDRDSPWSEKTLNLMTRHFANSTTKADQHCSSEVCHRITSLYGLLYEHSNLNVASHDILHELFGVASTKIFVHTGLITRKQRLVSFEGKDIYLPGFNKKNRLQDREFRRKMDLLNIPIMFFYGERNQCWDPENLVLMYNMVKDANPEQDYSLYEAERYGHLDGFMGKQAYIDVFPKLVRWLDKYAEDNHVNDSRVKSLVSKALVKEDTESSGIRKTKSPNASLVIKLAGELDSSKEIPCDNDDATENHDRELTDDDAGGEHSDTSDIVYDLSDVKKEELYRVKFEMEEMLNKSLNLLWERKFAHNSTFHFTPRYQPPEATNAEQVLIKAFTFNDNTKKREIYALSDLHLGVDWSKEIESRLLNFVATMARIAEECVHSLVLVGDIMEMCMTPVAVTPPTEEEFMDAWKKDNVVTSFASAIRKMADEDGVNVFYVRGDHDRDITQQMVKELFGENVIFVPGCLVFKIDVMTKQYTIRFEHGHSADVFSSYNFLKSKASINDRPLSYYVTRALSSTQERFFSDTGNIIRNYTKKTLKLVPSIYGGSTIVDILSTGPFSKRFNKKLIETAIGKDLTGEESVIMSDENWIRFSNIFTSRFLAEAISQHGASDVYQMLKSSIGDLSFYVKNCYEDVVVMGHSHVCTLKKMPSKGGSTIYANCGTWIDLVSNHSYVKIIPPTSRLHGEVEVKFEEN